jgi:hypothetical protein
MEDTYLDRLVLIIFPFHDIDLILITANKEQVLQIRRQSIYWLNINLLNGLRLHQEALILKDHLVQDQSVLMQTCIEALLWNMHLLNEAVMFNLNNDG